jgi:nucleotide-binding universal stress UspA family protein
LNARRARIPRQIIRAASEQTSDMIVLGNRILGYLAGLMLGSVAHQVAQMTPCTCITLR